MATKKREKRRRKKLNDLSGREWIKHSISWFTLNPQNRLDQQIKHPGKFPEELATRFIELFTQKGDWVIDPFVGVGSTLLASKRLGRNGVGIEINEKFATTAREFVNPPSDLKRENETMTKVLVGDSMEINQVLEGEFAEDIPQFDLCVTSPPYWNMLRKSRGGSDSQHKERIEKNLSTYYSEDNRDLGNIEDYREFLDCILHIFENLRAHIKPFGHIVVILQNIRDEQQVVNPLAWEFALAMRESYKLEQEQIWCQTDKRAGIWGYPSTYVSNVHHHYCLVFSKDGMT